MSNYYGGRGGGRSSSRGFGRTGRGRGRGPQQLTSHSGEEFGLNICRYFVTNTCRYGDTCSQEHAVSMLAQVDAAPRSIALNCLVQWQETNVITASNEGCIKMWTTADGAVWNEAAKVDLTPHLSVTSLLVVDPFVACAYEAPFALAAQPPPAARAPSPPPQQQRGYGGAPGALRGDDAAGALQPPRAERMITVGMIRMLNLRGGEPAAVEVVISDKVPYAHTHPINCLAQLKDAAGALVLFSGGDEGLIRAWKAQGTGFQLGGVLEGHVRGVTCLCMVGNMLWSASKDHTVRVWDTATMACLGIIGSTGGLGHKGAVTCMAGPLSIEGEQGEYMVTGSADKSVSVWHAGTGERVHQASTHGLVTALTCFKTSPSGPLLLIGSDDGSIALRDFPGFSLAFELSAAVLNVGHRTPVRALLPLEIPGPNLYFMSGAEDGKMMMWQMALKPPQQ